MTLQIPHSPIGWFEQMVRSMGWSFRCEDSAVEEEKRPAITPALRRSINKARKESERGETIRCRNKTEMQQYFDSL